jgi:hypothetical protein
MPAVMPFFMTNFVVRAGITGSRPVRLKSRSPGLPQAVDNGTVFATVRYRATIR